MHRLHRFQNCKYRIRGLLNNVKSFPAYGHGRNLISKRNMASYESLCMKVNLRFAKLHKLKNGKAKTLLLPDRDLHSWQQTAFHLSTKPAPTLASDTNTPGRHRHGSAKGKTGRKKTSRQKTRPPNPSSDQMEEDKKIEIDDSMTIFLSSSKRVIDVKMRKDREFSLFFPKSEELISIALKEREILEQVKRDLDRQEALDPKIQSIDEFMWTKVALDLKELPQYYLQLSKIRLTGLVVITEVAGYFMAPGVFHPVTLALATLGTGLASSSANALNQFFEVPYDSQMNRTKNRVLVRGRLSPLHAVGFAVVAGTVGVTTLALGVNELTAALGALNIGLYAFVYTPMKRLNVANTWVGSLVGAVPPVMGWTAATGAIDPGALLLAGIMYAWQFPHFNALSWNLRQDYSRAGYRMMSVVNPALCKRVAFRYTLGLVALCTLAPVINLTTWTFAVDSLPLNMYFAYLGWRFYRDGDSKSSRKLFRFSLIHIPALLVLMFISKKEYKQRTRPRTLDDEPLSLESHDVSR